MGPGIPRPDYPEWPNEPIEPDRRSDPERRGPDEPDRFPEYQDVPPTEPEDEEPLTLPENRFPLPSF
jgi:hypothetical protein